MIKKTVGPYSTFRKAGNFIYLSGQIGIDSNTDKLVEGIEKQTNKVMENITDILKENDYSLDDIVKVNILLDSIEDYGIVNEIYASYLKQPYPARTCYEVSNLPLGALIEVEIIAYKEK